MTSRILFPGQRTLLTFLGAVLSSDNVKRRWIANLILSFKKGELMEHVKHIKETDPEIFKIFPALEMLILLSYSDKTKLSIPEWIPDGLNGLELVEFVIANAVITFDTIISQSEAEQCSFDKFKNILLAMLEGNGLFLPIELKRKLLIEKEKCKTKSPTLSQKELDTLAQNFESEVNKQVGEEGKKRAHYAVSSARKAVSSARIALLTEQEAFEKAEEYVRTIRETVSQSQKYKYTEDETDYWIDCLEKAERDLERTKATVVKLEAILNAAIAHVNSFHTLFVGTV